MRDRNLWELLSLRKKGFRSQNENKPVGEGGELDGQSWIPL